MAFDQLWRDISGSGFVILDYEELGAFCDQDCGDRCFRSYLYEEAEEGTLLASQWKQEEPGVGVRSAAVGDE